MMQFENAKQTLIDRLQLQAHPEGGYYVRTYESDTQISVSERYAGDAKQRPSLTSIYYLLSGNAYSAWHKLQSDEIWFHHVGSAFNLYVLDPDTQALNTYVLGDPLQCDDASPQRMVPHGHWFCADLVDKSTFGLCGCAVSPGFHFNDFQLATVDELLEGYPKHEAMIRQFVV